MERDNLVDTVEELGAEGVAKRIVNLVGQLRQALRRRFHIALHDVFHDVAHGLLLGVRAFVFANSLGADVAGHDDDGVLERHQATLAVRQTAVVKHLQQDVENVGVSLLHLIEQDDAIRATTHRLGKLTALVVADVSRRGTDQALHAELLHVLGHVDAHHGLLAVEQVFRQRLCQLGFTHAGRAEEQEAADGLVRVGQACAVATDSAGDRRDRFVLADDALMQLVLEIDELLHLALHHLGHGDAGPGGHHLGDLLLRYLLLEDGAVLLLVVECLLCLLQLALQLGDAAVADLGGLHQVAFAGCALLFGLRSL